MNFLFTSDRNEGWGVVLNEAMNSACAVVADYSIGSVPYLIKNDENELYYKNKREFLSHVYKLATDVSLRRHLQNSAYNIIIKTWNANNAGANFIKLVDGLLNGNKPCITEGPCSEA